MQNLMIIISFILWLQWTVPLSGTYQDADYKNELTNYEVIEKLELSNSQIQRIEQSNPELCHKVMEFSARLKANEAKLKSLMNTEPIDKISILELAELSTEALMTLRNAEAKMLLPIQEELTGKQKQILMQIQKLRLASIAKVVKTPSIKIVLPNGQEIPLVLTNPKIIKEMKPLYTKEARKNRVEGVLVLKAIVRKNGSIDNFEVIQSLGYDLDESAIRTIMKEWKFIPRMVDGQPVDSPVDISVDFKINKRR